MFDPNVTNSFLLASYSVKELSPFRLDLPDENNFCHKKIGNRKTWTAQLSGFVFCLLVSLLFCSASFANSFPPFVNLTLQDESQLQDQYSTFQISIDGTEISRGSMLADMDGDSKADFVVLSGGDAACTELVVVLSTFATGDSLTDLSLEQTLRYQLPQALTSVDSDSCISPEIAFNGGDLNGDGVDDLLLPVFGFSDGEDFASTTLVLFGRMTPGLIEISTENSGWGVRVDSSQLLGVGDVNGDGVDDFSVDGTTVVAGSSQLNSMSGLLDIADLQVLFASDLQESFALVSPVGDLDNDGFDDLQVVSGFFSVAELGTRLIYGAGSFEPDLLAQVISRNAGNDISCDNDFCSVTSVGDVNGDSVDDFLFSVLPFFNPSTESSQRLVFGSGVRPRVDEFADSVELVNSSVENPFGLFTASAGDLNGDSIRDLILRETPTSTYVIYGENEWPDTVDVATLDGNNGFAIATNQNNFILNTQVFDFDDDSFDELVFYGSEGGSVLQGQAGANDLPNIENLRVAFAESTFTLWWGVPQESSLIERLQIFSDDAVVASIVATDGYHVFDYSVLEAGTTLSVNAVLSDGRQIPRISFDAFGQRYLIDSFRAQIYSANTVELFWESVNSRYNVWRNGELLDTVEGTSYLDESVLPGENYVYWVTLVPDSSNLSFSDFNSVDSQIVFDDDFFIQCGFSFEDFDLRGPTLRTYAPRTTELLELSTSPSQATATVFANGMGQADDCDPSFINAPLFNSENIYSETSLEIFWERSSSLSYDSFEYEIIRDAEVLGTTDGSSFFDDDVQAGTTYLYTVTAIAPDGIRSSSDSRAVFVPAFEVLSENGTITWPDNGWYEVQSSTDNSTICSGTRFCTPGEGTYIVINHTSGERFNDIQVRGVADTDSLVVEEGTISWADDGWYQVQRAGSFETVCEGGRSCEVVPGEYIVINHSTGQRFENVVVAGETVEAVAGPSTVSVEGDLLVWSDNGWFQVQSAPDYQTICEGGVSCEVGPGTYTVINHTTGERFDDIVVSASAQVEELVVVGDIISWPDDGWYQVQLQETSASVCEGGRSCQVEPGVYTVINHTSGERFEDIVVQSEQGNPLGDDDEDGVENFQDVDQTGGPDYDFDGIDDLFQPEGDSDGDGILNIMDIDLTGGFDEDFNGIDDAFQP